MNEFRDNEVVAPTLLSNSMHLQTNTRHPVREFHAPQVQKVMDYSKNVSQSIFSPGCLAEDYESMIPESIQRYDKKMNRTSSVRMHNYRGTTNLWFGYDPEAPVAIPKKKSKVNDKFDKIKVLRSQIANETAKREKAEKDLANVRASIKSLQSPQN